VNKPCSIEVVRKGFCFLVTGEGEVIGYIKAIVKKIRPGKIDVTYEGVPGCVKRDGWVFVASAMSCVARKVVETYEKKGKLEWGVYGDEARKLFLGETEHVE